VVEGANLSAATTLLGGRLTALNFTLVTDGRVTRPLVQMAGERMLPEDADPGDAPAAVRALLTEVVEAVPPASLDGEGKFELNALVAGLPQATGTLRLGVSSKDGISAARLALFGLIDDPKDKTAVSKLFEGVEIDAKWEEGKLR
jgi:hypothetical protein